MVEWWMTYAQWQHLEGLLAQLPNYTTTTVLWKEPAAVRKDRALWLESGERFAC